MTASSPTLPRLLDLKRVEQEYGLSYWQTYALVARGELPAIRPTTRRRILLDRRDLEAWIDSHRERAGDWAGSGDSLVTDAQKRPVNTGAIRRARDTQSRAHRRQSGTTSPDSEAIR